MAGVVDALSKGEAEVFEKNTDIYKYINDEMRNSLKSIFQEIHEASSFDHSQAQETDEIFDEASSQLSAIVQATEKVTLQIMDIIERRIDLQMETAKIISDLKIGKINWERLERLEEINAGLGDDMSEVMTALSFQDLTGQRIKKVVKALAQIEKIIIELYVSSAVLVKSRESAPNTDIKVLEKEVQVTVQKIKDDMKKSELKGPQDGGSSQADIDDLLAQLGI